MDKSNPILFYNLFFSPDAKKVRRLIILWILLLLVIPIPTIFGNSNLIQSALGQTESPSTPLTEETIQTLKSDQDKRLPMQKGFSTSVLATNLSAPCNILYGPDKVLWITELTGKEITRIDPNTGAELSVIQVPNVHQAGKGQDGLRAWRLTPTSTIHTISM